MSTCRSCGAPIVWAHTGKTAMPLDLAPRADGNVVIRAGVAVVLGALELTAEKGPRFTSHFATCKDAAAWRKR